MNRWMTGSAALGAKLLRDRHPVTFKNAMLMPIRLRKVQVPRGRKRKTSEQLNHRRYGESSGKTLKASKITPTSKATRQFIFGSRHFRRASTTIVKNMDNPEWKSFIRLDQSGDRRKNQPMGKLGDHRYVNEGGVIETGRPSAMTMFFFLSLPSEVIEFYVVGYRDTRIAMQQHPPL